MKKVKISITLIVAIFISSEVNAQMKIGNNPKVINPNSILEIEHTNKGLLLPRIELSSTISSAPMSAHLAGMIVYNTATIADVSPSFYYNDGTRWIRVGAVRADSTTSSNGLTMTGKDVKLGGSLTAATTVTTSATNTLALAGLQSGTTADSIVMLDGTSGVLKKMSTTVMSDKTQANNGLTKSGDTIQLGGSLTKATTISMGDKTLNFSSAPTTGTSHFSIDSTTFSINTIDNSIGIGTRSPNPSALLDLYSLNKGVLLPRLSQVQRDAIPAPSAGLAIYNTTENCVNFYEGTKWRSTCRANINATFQSATINCGGTLNGDYVATVPMNDNNFKQVTVTCNTPGDYTISTNKVNGVVFSGEGTLVSAGAGTSIVLKASGTPIVPGTFTYTVTLTGLNCTFNITFQNAPAQLVSDSVDCNTSSVASGTYMVGVPMTVSNIKTVKTVPETIGYNNIETDVVNGVKFSKSTIFTAGQVNNSQTISLVATGTPLVSGTFTYKVGGTDVTNACSFQVTFACPKPNATILTSTAMEASTTFANALVSPAPGKFLIFGTSNLWTNDYRTWLSYSTDFNGTLFTDNSFIQANCPWNGYQSISFGGEVSVSSAGSHSLRMYQVWGNGGANYTQKNVLALYIPTSGGCDSIITGSIGQAGFQTFNNTPTTGTHRFNLSTPSDGKLLVVSSAQALGSNIGSSNPYIPYTGELSYSLKVGSQTSTNKILANGIYAFKRVNGLGVFDVTGGNVNVDLTRTQGIYNSDPSMQYIFIPKTSRVQAGYFQPISNENVSNTPSANSNRFSINLPANIGAGQLILLGNMNMWRNSAAPDLGYNVNITTASTSNALVTTASISSGIIANAQEQISFFTKYDITSTAANSVIHIDYVPNTSFTSVGAPRLAWVFIPN